MKLRDVMSHNVKSISADTNLLEAANAMARLDIGFLAVVDKDIAGVITDRDIVVRGVAQGLPPSTTLVREVMTPDVAVLSDEESVSAAAELMKDKQIRRLLVQDSKGAYVGVVSLGDLAVEGEDAEMTGETMKEVCS